MKNVVSLLHKNQSSRVKYIPGVDDLTVISCQAVPPNWTVPVHRNKDAQTCLSASDTGLGFADRSVRGICGGDPHRYKPLQVSGYCCVQLYHHHICIGDMNIRRGLPGSISRACRCAVLFTLHVLRSVTYRHAGSRRTQTCLDEYISQVNKSGTYVLSAFKAKTQLTGNSNHAAGIQLRHKVLTIIISYYLSVLRTFARENLLRGGI